MAEKKKWVVVASGDRPLKEVKEKLSRTGFDVDQVFDEIGCIIGEATDEVAEKMRAVDGVADVSPEPPPVSIGPPDSLIQ